MNTRPVLPALLTCLLMLGLAACAPAAPTLTHTPTPPPSLTPSLTPSPSLTPTPSSTPTQPPHSDLDPLHTQDLTGTYQGIQIKTLLVTDRTSADEASMISMQSAQAADVMAEFWVRAAYRLWLQQGGPDGTGPDPSLGTGMENFWGYWRAAQKSGARADWEKVQITLYANDLSQPGYNQQPVKFWLGYQGGDPPPAGTVAVREIDLGIVAGSVPHVTPWGVFGAGIGTNYLGDVMYMYICKYQEGYYTYSDLNLWLLVSYIPRWWQGNTGQALATLKTTPDYDFMAILRRGGFKISPPDGYVPSPTPAHKPVGTRIP